MAPTPTRPTAVSRTSTVSYIEPHPSISSNPRISSGIGGAGNFTRYNKANLTAGPTATGPAFRTSISSTRSSTSAAATATANAAAADARRPSTASSAASTSSTSSTFSARRVFTGRGGAGNAKLPSERRIFSFDEELERQQRLTENAKSVPIYHVGRGGAGNAFADAATGPQPAVGGVEKAKRSLDGVRGRVARVFTRD